MPTPLDNYPSARQALYTAFWVIGLILGGMQVWYASTGGVPSWLGGVMSVYAFLGSGIGYMAAANMQK